MEGGPTGATWAGAGGAAGGPRGAPLLWPHGGRVGRGGGVGGGGGRGRCRRGWSAGAPPTAPGVASPSTHSPLWEQHGGVSKRGLEKIRPHGNVYAEE